MRLKIHRIIYLLLLILLAVAMTTSNFLMNLAWVLLFANWVIEWDMKRKFSDFLHNYLLHAFLFLLVLHLAGLLWSDNLAYGLDDLRKKLPIFAIALVVLTSRPLTFKQWRLVSVCYVLTVFVVSVIGFVRFLSIPDLPHRLIIPYISHIRFCLNVCMSIVLLVAMVLIEGRNPVRNGAVAVTAVSILLIVWFVLFLVLMQSYTGFVILLVTAVVSLLVGWRKIASRKARWALASLLLAIVLGVVGVSVYLINDYYTPRSAASVASARTVNGNPYTYSRDGLIENGSYVNDRVCEVELRSEWPKVSSYPIDSITATGYPVYPALVRYLNASGLGKDSVGVHCLTASDIAAIEQGVGNPVYLQRLSLRKMFCVMLFEYENYRCFNSVKDFTVLQRLELWRNGWQVFLDNMVYGTGTGDVQDCCVRQLKESGSPMADNPKRTHNQYLTFLITFGIVGFVLLLFAFLWAIFRKRMFGSVLFTAFFCIMAVSFLSEDTLETLAGVVFVTFFFTLLSQHSAVQLKHSSKQQDNNPEIAN